MGAAALAKLDFYPRPPRGGRRPSLRATTCHTYFYPRPPRGGRPQTIWDFLPRLKISIHALREEGDVSLDGLRGEAVVISIHALREEGDLSGYDMFKQYNISIHALREEGDINYRTKQTHNNYFYPRPPRGGRRAITAAPSTTVDFYPRPPRGGRQRPCGKRGKPLRFLSTPSARRATSLPSTTRKSSANFYPRPPRGGRPHTAVGWHNAKLFLSTPSARRATFKRRQDVKLTIFLSTPSARRATM